MKRVYITVLLLQVLNLLLLQAVIAEEFGRIEGKIVDGDTGKALSAASIVIKGTTLKAVTDSEGRYLIANIPPRSYQVEATMADYVSLTKEITISAGEGLVINFWLPRLPILRETLVVTAARSEIPIENLPMSATVITSDDIGKMHIRTVDDALNKVEGVRVRRPEGMSTTGSHASLFMRGTADASRTLILKDGVPINTTYIGSIELWDTMGYENIDKIEVVRGAASALYGSNAMGGVVNIITQPPREKTVGSASLEYGSLDTYISNINLSRAFDKFGFRFSAGRKGTNGYRYYKPERWKDYYKTTETDLTNVSAGTNIRLGLSTLKLDYEYFGRESFKATATQYDGEASTHKYMVGYSIPIGKTFYSAKFCYFDYGYETNALKYNKTTGVHDIFYYDSNIPKNEWGVMLQASREINSHHLTIGSDLRWGNCDSNYEYDTGPRTFTGNQNLYSFFINDEISLGKKLILSAGIRYDWWKHHSGYFNDETTSKEISIEYPDKSDSAFSPRAGITYHLVKNTKLRASFGTGFRVPGIYYLYKSGPHGAARFDLGNPELGPERMTYSFDVGFDTKLVEALDLTFTFYRSSFKDFMHDRTLKPEEVPSYFSPEPGLAVMQKVNVGRVNIFGIETGLKLALNSYWAAFANYTYNESKIKEYEEKPEVVDNLLSYTPHHMANLGLTYDNPDLFTASIFLRYMGENFGDLENTEAKRVDGYAVVDMRVSRTLFHQMKLFINVDNLTDNEYTDYYYQDYAPPRTVMVGVRYAF